MSPGYWPAVTAARRFRTRIPPDGAVAPLASGNGEPCGVIDGFWAVVLTLVYGRTILGLFQGIAATAFGPGGVRRLSLYSRKSASRAAIASTLTRGDPEARPEEALQAPPSICSASPWPQLRA